MSDESTREPRTVLVTGASGGIGAAIARRFAQRGERVVCHYHRGADAARALAASLPGAGHSVACADLADPASVRAMIEPLERLDVLVNNAGIYEERPLLETEWDEWVASWRRTIDTNLSSAAYASYWAARLMRSGARIVHIGSRGGYRGEPASLAYGASKAGMHQLAQSMAIALAPRGISVFAIAPGFVETEMARAHLEGAAGDAIRAQSPFGRVASPADVAYWVEAVCAPEAAFASGAVIDVNGASYLR